MPGTIVQAFTNIGHVRRVTLTCTADAAAATFPDTVLSQAIEGRLLKLVTNPGAVQPTDNYGVTLEDQHGHDVLEGVGANRDTLNTEEAPIVYAGTAVHPVVDDSDTLTLKISGNAVNSAAVVIDLYYALGA
jgi:hypothetical protein